MIPLPRLMLVTHSASMRPDFATALEAALCGGARLIQFRESDENADEHAQNFASARELCALFGATLMFNGDEDAARAANADGVHWPSRLIPANAPAPKKHHSDRFLRGASVHSLDEARRAEQAGAHYLVFGSVWATASHPGAPPAGLDALRAVCQSVSIPTFAIGGVTMDNAMRCRAAGAWGIAAIRAAWDAPDIEIAVRELLDAANAR